MRHTVISKFWVLGRTLLFTLAILGQSFSSLSQTWTIKGDDEEYKCKAVSPEALKINFKKRKLRKYKGFPGGIVIGQKAIPANGYLVEDFSLYYDELAVDGYRLKVVINGDTLSPYLPDWQLKPIAEFADSRHTAVVDVNAGDSILLHPAFTHTLMGARLWQFDKLIFDPFAQRNLAEYNGSMVYGRGENVSFEKVDDTFCTYLLLPIYQYMETHDVDGLAVLLHDGASKVTFQSTDNRLLLNWQPNVSFYKELKKNKPFDEVDSLSDLYNSIWLAIERVNPVLYESYERASVYGAFLRYAKNENRAAWKLFIKEVGDITISPDVLTPSYPWNKK